MDSASAAAASIDGDGRQELWLHRAPACSVPMPPVPVVAFSFDGEMATHCAAV